MKILVASCDKNEDLFLPFHHCIEKYWPDHPEIIYCTETLDNPYYKTIKKNYDLENWTSRIREAVEEIDDNYILLMCDDIFITDYVNNDSVLSLCNAMTNDIASVNLQVANKDTTKDIGNNLRLMKDDAQYKTSVMCSLWKKDKLLDVFNVKLSPWKFEVLNDGKSYKYCRLNEKVISWGGEISGTIFGVFRGKWDKNAAKFLLDEGLDIDYSIRGYYG